MWWFVASTDAIYQNFSTSNAAASIPPGPDWTSKGDIPAIAGEVETFSITYPVLDPVRIYRVIANCS